MEILEQLEERVSALLARLEALAKENANLKEQEAAFLSLQKENEELKKQVAASDAVEKENRSLRDERDRERQKNRVALARVDDIIRRLNDLPE
ncbi:MAG: hypothetical protein LBO77_03810 [Desulfovibrio sp.]|jgi:FtsZ-binding cell division protein ZapB|nr:hypothetical protein [Desulfovibrio sp.]